MRKEECEFSHFTIQPGKGRKYIPFAFISTKPVLGFARPKCFALYMRKKNPRSVPWTRTYRRLNRKVASDAAVKRRSYKVARVQRAIVGADLAFIQEVRAKHGQKQDRSAAAKAARTEVAERKTAKAAPAPKPAKK
mgnify:FL=1